MNQLKEGTATHSSVNLSEHVTLVDRSQSRIVDPSENYPKEYLAITDYITSNSPLKIDLEYKSV